MANIYGQDKLLHKLDAYTIENAPKTVLLTGEDGFARKDIIQYYAKRLSAEIVDVDSNITQEQIMEYLSCPVRKLYHIDLVKFTEKQQNQFLKFIEEPTNTVFIILEAESEIGILPTILNRCVKFALKSYTPEEMKEHFSWLVSNEDERIFKICNTPEQLQNLPVKAFFALYDDCTALIKDIKKVSYGDLMQFILKVNCKENYNCCDLIIFFRIMAYCSFNLFKEKDEGFEIYRTTIDYMQRLSLRTVAKETLLINYLTELWEATR